MTVNPSEERTRWRRSRRKVLRHRSRTEATQAVSSGSSDAEMRHLVRSLSALMSWSMEDAIEAADSMQARHYSLAEPKKRSSFRFYRFTAGDAFTLAYLTATALASIVTLVLAGRNFRFFPMIQGMDALPPITFLVIAALMIYPLALKAKEQAQWLHL